MPDTATRAEVTYDDVHALLHEISDLLADCLDALAAQLEQGDHR